MRIAIFLFRKQDLHCFFGTQKRHSFKFALFCNWWLRLFYSHFLINVIDVFKSGLIAE